MKFDKAQKVADAVLYEGYLLYPYRASATKNQARWQFGVVMPRDYIEDNYRRPLGERMLRRLVAELLPYPRRFALALRLARLAAPFSGILPPRLRNLVGLAVAGPPAGEILAPGIYPAEGARNARVALLASGSDPPSLPVSRSQK